jgi:hypothetical protein
MNSTKINITESEQSKSYSGKTLNEQSKLALSWQNINVYAETKSGIFRKAKNERIHILKERKIYLNSLDRF